MENVLTLQRMSWMYEIIYLYDNSIKSVILNLGLLHREDVHICIWMANKEIASK